jgi:peptidylprolyl isomerase
MQERVRSERSRPSGLPASSASPRLLARGVSTAAKDRPALAVAPGGKPPIKLAEETVRQGRGRPVEDGDAVTIKYVASKWSDGKTFDRTWGGGREFRFLVGAGDVLPGLERGVVGMRVGERRLLVIPPKLGYAAKQWPSVVDPTETLVFVADLTAIEGSPASPPETMTERDRQRLAKAEAEVRDFRRSKRPSGSSSSPHREPSR